MEKFCKNYIPRNRSDRAYLNGKKIEVSHTSIMYPSEGAGILAHELGHFVFSEFNQNNVQDLHRCLAMRHFWDKSNLNKNRNYWLYLKEDFSDYFASQVTSSIKSLEEKNMACLFFHSKKGHIDFQNTSHPMIWNSYKGREHSTPMFRFLHFENQKPNMSPSCSQFTTISSQLEFSKKGQKIVVPRMYQCKH